MNELGGGGPILLLSAARMLCPAGCLPGRRLAGASVDTPILTGIRNMDVVLASMLQSSWERHRGRDSVNYIW